MAEGTDNNYLWWTGIATAATAAVGAILRFLPRIFRDRYNADIASQKQGHQQDMDMLNIALTRIATLEAGQQHMYGMLMECEKKHAVCEETQRINQAEFQRQLDTLRKQVAAIPK